MISLSKLRQKADEAAKTATESFGDFEIPESEFERLNLQLENATEKNEPVAG